MRLSLLLLMLCLSGYGYSQNLLSQAFGASGLQKEATDGVHSVSNKSLAFLQNKYSKLSASVEKQSQQMLGRMQKKEEKLRRKLGRKDSAKAADLFAGVQSRYQSLQAGITDPIRDSRNKWLSLPQRLSQVDSLQKALHHREQEDTVLSKAEQKEISGADSVLQTMQKKLQDKISGRDSSEAAALLSNIESKYRHLSEKLSSSFSEKASFPLTEYIPGIDSMQTTLRFLQSKNGGFPQEKLQEITKASGELQGLQGKLQKANEIESFVKARERQLKEQLQNTGVAKQLKSINKEAFYYSQRLREYKDALKSPEKMEQKVLGAVRDSRFFQSFMQKHSYLAKLFPTPQNYGTPAALAGLQTRASVQQSLQQRFGVSSFTADAQGGSTPGSQPSTGGAGGNYLQQQMQTAQTQLSSVKDKMSKLGINGGSSDMTMPDFKPNTQHTKSFLQRIEYGMNIQSERSHSIVPTTSDLALTAGYKINDKSTLGIGGSYKMGWGSGGIKHIRMSSEGVGLRSYVDIKAKGALWITGGYEMNYMQSFRKYDQLKNLSAWQRSGLIGLTKKYKVGKKENNIQLLWDFLSYQQIPRTPALKFRVGFTL